MHLLPTLLPKEPARLPEVRRLARLHSSLHGVEWQREEPLRDSSPASCHRTHPQRRRDVTTTPQYPAAVAQEAALHSNSFITTAATAASTAARTLAIVADITTTAAEGVITITSGAG